MLESHDAHHVEHDASNSACLDVVEHCTVHYASLMNAMNAMNKGLESLLMMAALQ
jgi:hypothetical protein